MSGDENDPLLAQTDQVVDEATLAERKRAEDARRSKLLAVSFVLMVIVGLGNKIFQKLQTEPMHDYPYFLSLLTTFIYIPTSFAYIYPMIWWGKQITPEQLAIPKYKFAIMGTLDGIAGVMQVFAVTYISSGGLIILLTQSAIPISMIITKVMLKAKYRMWHYVGAFVVVCGLIVVLLPMFDPALEPTTTTAMMTTTTTAMTTITTTTDMTTTTAPAPAPQSKAMFFVWISVLLLSCVPMALSSVYKEKALGETEIDVVYLNGWVAVFQAIVTVIFAVPCGYAQSPVIAWNELPMNVVNGFNCYIGKTLPGSQYADCHLSPLFVNVYMAFNILYNIFIILILKYGSSNILYMAMTIMVPMGNFAFTLKFLPNNRPMTIYDIIGLVVIMSGLIVYRFFGNIHAFYMRKYHPELEETNEVSESLDDVVTEGSLKYPLLGSVMSSADALFVVGSERMPLTRSQQQIRAAYFVKLGIGKPVPSSAATINHAPSDEKATLDSFAKK